MPGSPYHEEHTCSPKGWAYCCSKDHIGEPWGVSKGESQGRVLIGLWGLELVKGWSLAEMDQNLQSRDLLEQSTILVWEHRSP